ncbi:MAG: hypothetical protein ACOC91_02680, partial [bacterium]
GQGRRVASETEERYVRTRHEEGKRGDGTYDEAGRFGGATKGAPEPRRPTGRSGSWSGIGPSDRER